MIWVYLTATMALTTVVFASLWGVSVSGRYAKLERKASRLQRRVQGMSRQELPQWAEQGLGETGRSFSAWRRSGEPVLLDEAYLGAEVVLSVIKELQRRPQ